MNKGYILCCWCIVILLTRVGDSWDQSPSPPEDEGDDYSYAELHDGCKLIKRT